MCEYSSADSLWNTGPIPYPPRIEATITQNGQWNMTTKTMIDSNLTVLQNTVLTMLCVASYPVIWQKGQEHHLPQQQYSCKEEGYLCSEYVADNLLKTVSDYVASGLLIPVAAVKEYQALITYNATSAIGGTYSCVGYRLQFSTSVVIKIRGDVRLNEPGVQLLQRSFERLFDWNFGLKPFSIAFIFNTSGTPVYPTVYSVRDADILDNLTCPGSSIAPTSTKDLLSDVVKVTFELANKDICGDYRLFIQDDSGNEILNDAFKKPPSSYVDPATRNYLSASQDGLLLTKGEIYSIQLRISLEFDRIWLEVYESELDPGRPLPFSPYCSQKAMSEESADRCGIVAVMANEVAGEESVVLILNATQPCSFAIRYDNFYFDKNKNMLVNLTAVRKKLQVSVEDESAFGENQTISIPPSNIPNGIEVYTNQSLELQCFFPICEVNTDVGWCKWMNKTLYCYGKWLDPLDDSVNITNYRFGTCTLLVSLKFSQIQKSHEGLYGCGKRTLTVSAEFPPIANYFPSPDFYVKVTDPIAPFFTDMKGEVAVTELLPTNEATIPLYCPVDGRPEPKYSWNCSRQNNKINCTDEIDSSRSSIVVSQPGIYTCVASNEKGAVWRFYDVKKSNASIPLITTLPIVIAALLAGLIFLMVERWRRNKRLDAYFKELSDLLNSSEAFQLDPSTPINDQANLLHYNRDFEINRHSFSIQRKLLGDGEFGRIYLGVMNFSPAACSVAVKIPRDSMNPYHHRALLDELRIMCHIRPHVNVLSLIGACTTGIEKRQLFILTEFCENGSLKDYLIENRRHFEALEEEDNNRVKTLLSFAYQAAVGMIHLAAENIVHRDLALRNLLLTHHHIVKISDFGMSRKYDSVYRKSLSPDVPVPIFWMALESLFSDQYDQMSDVWSFGIVLWEIFNCGRRPYPDHEPDMAFRSWLRASEQNRLGPPKIVCEEMYNLMRDCWKVNPAIRPTFTKCKRQIGETLEKRSSSMYFTVLRNLADAGVVMTRRLLSAETNRPSLQDHNISCIYVGTPDTQSEDENGHSSMVVDRTEIDRGDCEIEASSSSVSEDIEISVISDATNLGRKVKPYVAASLTSL